PSPQVAGMRKELAALQADYASRSDEPTVTPVPSGTSAATAGYAAGATPPAQAQSEMLLLDQDLREDRDPITVYARAQLRDAMEKHSIVRAQVRGAEIDL